MYRVSSFLQHFAWALIAGSLAASIWLNLDAASYYDVIEFRVVSFRGLTGRSDAIYTFQDFVAYALMAMFLFYLSKELWEAFRLERGSFRDGRGAVPVLAALGGGLGAFLVWALLAVLRPYDEASGSLTGWTTILGSDVVLTYMLGRLIFRPNSPALHFLLMVTILMDVGGLLIYGLATLQLAPRLVWLVLPCVSAWVIWQFISRSTDARMTEVQRQRALRLWPYVLAMLTSWVGVAASGLPPALGFLPILPVIPHARHAFGLFAEAEGLLHDPLNRLGQALVWPLVVTMFLFGLTHGGIDMQGFAPISLTLVSALWLGKPLGVLLGALVLAPRLGYALPSQLRRRHVGFVALLCGMSFTIPALTLSGGLPGGYLQEAARLGLALSLWIGVLAILLGRIGKKTKPA